MHKKCNETQTTAFETFGSTGAKLIQFPVHRDPRGALTVAEYKDQIPFLPERVFFITDVPDGQSRGDHAKVNCEEILIAANGSVSVGVDSGREEFHVVLNKPHVALFVPRMLFCWQYDFSADAVLSVLSSRSYQSTQYISSRAAFREAVKKKHV